MDQFRAELAEDNMAPLWEVIRGLTPREPVPAAAPAIWRSATIAEKMAKACVVISAEEAERRVLVLENPKFRGQSQITTSLYAGIQMILPGEIASNHQHTASALRLILKGEGGYSSVAGEKVIMAPGDFLLTPTGVPHDHGTDGHEPVMWLDGLDVPIVQLLNAGFSSDCPDRQQGVTRPVGESEALYNSGLMPLGYERRGAASPVFHWPYRTTRKALDTLAQAQEWHPGHGLKLAFTDPTTGKSPIHTMGAYIQMLPAGFTGARHRVTDGTVFCVVEGAVTVTLDDAEWTAQPHDVFVVPGWAWHRFTAQNECILFSFSDRPLQEYLGFWRAESESRRNAV